MSIVTEEMRYRQRLCEYAIKYVLTIKTPPSHGGNSGSNPDRVTSLKTDGFIRLSFVFSSKDHKTTGLTGGFDC